MSHTTITPEHRTNERTPALLVEGGYTLPLPEGRGMTLPIIPRCFFPFSIFPRGNAIASPAHLKVASESISEAGLGVGGCGDKTSGGLGEMTLASLQGRGVGGEVPLNRFLSGGPGYITLAGFSRAC